MPQGNVPATSQRRRKFRSPRCHGIRNSSLSLLGAGAVWAPAFEERHNRIAVNRDNRTHLVTRTSGNNKDTTDQPQKSSEIPLCCVQTNERGTTDRKSTRLNSSHLGISYAVF